MNRAAVLLLGLALLGDAPQASALIAGTVRDQHGSPVVAARVALFSGGKEVARAVSASDGTFAVTGVPADAASIDCDFCEPVRKTIPDDGILVVFVRRNDAVTSRSPTHADVAALPYAYVESTLSLTPFVVLSQSARLYPGPQLSDRRNSGTGGLFVLNGVPDYDISANISPYLTIPERDFSDVSIQRSSDAYLYGDTSNAGTFVASTTDGSPFASAGSGVAFRAAQADPALQSSAAVSDDRGSDDRTRADGNVSLAVPNGLVNATLGAGQIDASSGAATLDSEFSSVRLSVQRTSGVDITGSLVADRGTYSYDSPVYDEESTWSDVDARGLIRSHADVAPFALVEFRRSTAQSTLGQARFETGFAIDRPHWNVVAALGSDQVSYAPYAGAPGARTTTHDDVFSTAWTPSSNMSWEASVSNGYVLPVFTSLYAPQSRAPYVPSNATLESTLTLSDARRARFELTALRFTSEGGEASGSAGASLAWQFTPQLSVRTWLLRIADNEQGAAAVGSTWFTYDTGALRIDAIVRRDLRDSQADAHLDFSVSGNISGRLRWFAGSERRNGSRAVDAGLRL